MTAGLAIRAAHVVVVPAVAEFDGRVREAIRGQGRLHMSEQWISWLIWCDWIAELKATDFPPSAGYATECSDSDSWGLLLMTSSSWSRSYSRRVSHTQARQEFPKSCSTSYSAGSATNRSYSISRGSFGKNGSTSSARYSTLLRGSRSRSNRKKL